MMLANFVVNDRKISEAVEARTSLADVLRDKLKLTGTHLRCEQGACGACTILVDGQTSRACITLAVACENATITTIEGLDNDGITASLREAFTEEHGLQCGFCTPGVLITARDIVMRLPDADETRVRYELSGNICRCTGYVGIVRAICRVLSDRRQASAMLPPATERALGPVGSHFSNTAPHRETSFGSNIPSAAVGVRVDVGDLGLGGKAPTIEIGQSFKIAKSPAVVWAFLGDLDKVVPCLPGAQLTQPIVDNHVYGQFSVKLGPITARFNGEVRVVRDEDKQRGTILGAGRDGLSGSRTRAEIEYVLTPLQNGNETRVDFTIKSLVTGSLAQFSRASIVEDLVGRITAAFAENLSRRLNSPDSAEVEMQGAPLMAGSLLRAVIMAKIRTFFGRFRR
jgi:aerobic carbon-monoxide dehydrogenase small subunit